MKRTKTIEVEICDQCGDEQTYPHLEECIQCGKEVCSRCCHVFTVEVRETTPRRMNIGHGDVWGVTMRHANEFQYRGVFCGPCGNMIGATLASAGLAKSPVKDEGSAVTLDAATYCAGLTAMIESSQ